MKRALAAIACASCGGATPARVAPQAALSDLAAVLRPVVSAELQLRGMPGDTSVLVVCEPKAPELVVGDDRGGSRTGAIAARDCRALWAEALLAADSGGCGSDDRVAPVCVRAIDHGRIATACCPLDEDPLFDATVTDFEIAAARLPAHVRVGARDR